MDPFSLPVGIKSVCPEPDERCFPACPDLNPVRILHVTTVQRNHGNIVIPYGNVLISLPAANALRIKSDNIDFVRAKRDHAKETESISRCTADFPDQLGCSHRLKCRIRPRYVLQRFQFLQLFKDCLTGSRENRAFPYDHTFSSVLNLVSGMLLAPSSVSSSST